jgi:nucleoside-diphosphate-sugar epimerase
MASDHHEPINLGREDLVTIDELAAIVMKIAGKKLTIKHIGGPQGVRGRNSDNTLCKQILHWEPKITLEEGLKITYDWIYAQLKRDNLLSKV